MNQEILQLPQFSSLPYHIIVFFKPKNQHDFHFFPHFEAGFLNPKATFCLFLVRLRLHKRKWFHRGSIQTLSKMIVSTGSQTVEEKSSQLPWSFLRSRSYIRELPCFDSLGSCQHLGCQLAFGLGITVVCVALSDLVRLSFVHEFFHTF